jgi:hypothetical protein
MCRRITPSRDQGPGGDSQSITVSCETARGNGGSELRQCVKTLSSGQTNCRCPSGKFLHVSYVSSSERRHRKVFDPATHELDRFLVAEDRS